jgi:hypothetical protein
MQESAFNFLTCGPRNVLKQVINLRLYGVEFPDERRPRRGAWREGVRKLIICARPNRGGPEEENDRPFDDAFDGRKDVSADGRDLRRR